jgi:hypothetical protein
MKQTRKSRAVDRLIRILKRRCPLQSHEYSWPSRDIITAYAIYHLQEPAYWLRRNGHVASVEAAQVAKVRAILARSRKDVTNWCKRVMP